MQSAVIRDCRHPVSGAVASRPDRRALSSHVCTCRRPWPYQMFGCRTATAWYSAAGNSLVGRDSNQRTDHPSPAPRSRRGGKRGAQVELKTISRRPGPTLRERRKRSRCYRCACWVDRTGKPTSLPACAQSDHVPAGGQAWWGSSAARVVKWRWSRQASRLPMTNRRRLARLTATLRRFGREAAQARAPGRAGPVPKMQDDDVGFLALGGVDGADPVHGEQAAADLASSTPTSGGATRTPQALNSSTSAWGSQPFCGASSPCTKSASQSTVVTGFDTITTVPSISGRRGYPVRILVADVVRSRHRDLIAPAPGAAELGRNVAAGAIHPQHSGARASFSSMTPGLPATKPSQQLRP